MALYLELLNFGIKLMMVLILKYFFCLASKIWEEKRSRITVYNHYINEMLWVSGIFNISKYKAKLDINTNVFFPQWILKEFFLFVRLKKTDMVTIIWRWILRIIFTFMLLTSLSCFDTFVPYNSSSNQQSIDFAWLEAKQLSNQVTVFSTVIGLH